MVTNSLQLSAFRTMFQTMVDTAIISNAEGLILYSNPAIYTLLGYAVEDIIGKNLSILMPSYYGQRHSQYMKNYLDTKESKVIGTGRKVMAKAKNGDLRPCWLSLSEFKHEGKSYFAGILSDISDVERANQELETINSSLELTVQQRTNELKEALQQAKELNTLKSQFMTLTSHEFKTPLATILSSAILIEKHGQKWNNLNSNQQKHISRIKQSVGVLNSIIEDFLNIERAERDIVQTKFSSFSPDDLIEEAVTIIQLQAKKGQKIDVVQQGPIDVVTTDYQLTLQIVLNLLSNALKYSYENQTINLSYHSRDNALQISVCDQGRGISEKDKTHIFDRFFRASNVQAEKGTGIGLHISKKHAELLGGKLSFESELNKGSCFNLTLPKNQDNE